MLSRQQSRKHYNSGRNRNQWSNTDSHSPQHPLKLHHHPLNMWRLTSDTPTLVMHGRHHQKHAESMGIPRLWQPIMEPISHTTPLCHQKEPKVPSKLSPPMSKGQEAFTDNPKAYQTQELSLSFAMMPAQAMFINTAMQCIRIGALVMEVTILQRDVSEHKSSKITESSKIMWIQGVSWV